MPTMTYLQAISDAMRQEMRHDERVLVMGEDIGVFGGAFKVTDGFIDEFGPGRVMDTPLAESGIVGTAIGMALYGMRPVPEIQFGDYVYPAFDQIVNELAKFRYRSGGEYQAPLVVRMPVGGGIRGGHYHSQSPEALFIHTPGLKVVAPSNPYDAKGLLLASMRQNDPVLFMEPKRIYRASKADVPDGEYTIELGKARITREGAQVTVVAWSGMVTIAEDAARLAGEAGISVEVIDLRTLLPFDIDALIASTVKTGRVVIVHEAPRTCGFGAELIASIQERAMAHLEAPILRVTGFDTPFPYSLEHEYLPNPVRVLAAIRQTLEW